MNLNHVASRLGIFGPSGSGKTTLAKRYLAGWGAYFRLVFDHDHQWEQALGLAPSYSFPDCSQQLARNRICIFSPAKMFGSDVRTAFSEFCRFTFAVGKSFHGVKLLVAEELQTACDNRHPIPDSFRDILLLGRRAEIDLLAISHKPNEIHLDVRSELTHMAAFNFAEPVCLRWLREFGFDPKIISTLPLHAYAFKAPREPVRIFS